MQWSSTLAVVGLLLAGCAGEPNSGTDSRSEVSSECPPVIESGLEPNIRVLPQFATRGPEQAARLRLAIEGTPLDAPWKTVQGNTYTTPFGAYEVGGTTPRHGPHLVVFYRWGSSDWDMARVEQVAHAILAIWEVPPEDYPLVESQYSDANWTWLEYFQPAPYWGGQMNLDILRTPQGTRTEVWLDPLNDVETTWPISKEDAQRLAVPIVECLFAANGFQSSANVTVALSRTNGRVVYGAGATILNEAPCGSVAVSVDAETGHVLAARFGRGAAYPVAPCERAAYATY